MAKRELPMMNIGDIAKFYDGIQLRVVDIKNDVYHKVGLMDEITNEIKLHFRDLNTLNRVDCNGILSGMCIWGGIEEVIGKNLKRRNVK